MDLKIYNLDKKVVGTLSVSNDLFCKDIRLDLIKSVVDWQLAKRRVGSHKAKTVSEVSGTTRKPFKQKGTGQARQGSLRSVHMRGGGVSHGPVVRSHEIDLPKKVRKLALMHALSSKFLNLKLLVCEDLNVSSHKTKTVVDIIRRFELGKSLFIDDVVHDNFKKASNNLPDVMIIPENAANVYDIVRSEYLVLTVNAVKSLEKRLLNV